MLLEQLVHFTISSNRWPNHFRYVWLIYQIAAVHYPHWQGSIKKERHQDKKGKLQLWVEQFRQEMTRFI